MKTILFTSLLFFSISAAGQDPVVTDLKTEALRAPKPVPADTSKSFWKKGGVYNINVAQGALSNWAAGGDDFSLSINSLLSLFACYKKNKLSWDNSFDYNLGYIKTTSLGSRKNDDRFDYFSKMGYRIGKKINVAAVTDIRSQFLKTFAYDGEVKILSSSFMSPGNITTSFGLDFKPVKNLSVFISPVSSRWIFVKNNLPDIKLSYNIDSSRRSRNEIGAFATINYLRTMNKIITYKMRLDLLSNYKHNPQNVDVYMSNLMTVKLARYLSVTWSVDLIYDDDTKLFGKNHDSPALQLKSLTGLGLLMKI